MLFVPIMKRQWMDIRFPKRVTLYLHPMPSTNSASTTRVALSKCCTGHCGRVKSARSNSFHPMVYITSAKPYKIAICWKGLTATIDTKNWVDKVCKTWGNHPRLRKDGKMREFRINHGNMGKMETKKVRKKNTFFSVAKRWAFTNYFAALSQFLFGQLRWGYKMKKYEEEKTNKIEWKMKKN